MQILVCLAQASRFETPIHGQVLCRPSWWPVTCSRIVEEISVSKGIVEVGLLIKPIKPNEFGCVSAESTPY